MTKKLKQMPPLRSDEEAEDFVTNCDLTEYDLSGFKLFHYEFAEGAEIMPQKQLKKLPPLMSDKEAEDFVDNADLSEYDLSGWRRVHFEFAEEQDQPEKEPAAEPK